eukprot:GDKI01009516.1.p1 GENE.GDKI01009516.1~~GDKI01009516.1.p1  ORF type:complete len:191 (-),score=65.39 GDKI01009516.1:19-591(-)
MQVLALAKRYGGSSCVGRVSSFFWVPPHGGERCMNKEDPAVNDFTICPNGHIPADVLGPAAEYAHTHKMGIEMGLLFDTTLKEAAPAPEQLATMLDKYHTKWAHLRYSVTNLAETVRAMHAMWGGYKVMAWFGGHEADKESTIRAALAAGVDELCVNDIPLANKIMSGGGGGDVGVASINVRGVEQTAEL